VKYDWSIDVGIQYSLINRLYCGKKYSTVEAFLLCCHCCITSTISGGWAFTPIHLCRYFLGTVPIPAILLPFSACHCVHLYSAFLQCLSILHSLFLVLYYLVLWCLFILFLLVEDTVQSRGIHSVMWLLSYSMPAILQAWCHQALTLFLETTSHSE